MADKRWPCSSYVTSTFDRAETGVGSRSWNAWRLNRRLPGLRARKHPRVQSHFHQVRYTFEACRHQHRRERRSHSCKAGKTLPPACMHPLLHSLPGSGCRWICYVLLPAVVEQLFDGSFTLWRLRDIIVIFTKLFFEFIQNDPFFDDRHGSELWQTFSNHGAEDKRLAFRRQAAAFSNSCVWMAGFTMSRTNCEGSAP